MGRVMTIGVERGDEIEEIRIRPIKNNEGLLDKYSATYGILFIAQDAPEEFVKYNPFKPLGRAAHESWVITTGTLEALGQMITGTRSATGGGVIRIGALAGDGAARFYCFDSVYGAALNQSGAN